MAKFVAAEIDFGAASWATKKPLPVAKLMGPHMYDYTAESHQGGTGPRMGVAGEIRLSWTPASIVTQPSPNSKPDSSSKSWVQDNPHNSLRSWAYIQYVMTARTMRELHAASTAACNVSHLTNRQKTTFFVPKRHSVLRYFNCCSL